MGNQIMSLVEWVYLPLSQDYWVLLLAPWWAGLMTRQLCQWEPRDKWEKEYSEAEGVAG